MRIAIREFTKTDIAAMAKIWNEVVAAGEAFPQEEPLTEKEAGRFFAAQSYSGVAENKETGEIVGLYILHPNNVGRCAHIANTSYAVKNSYKGQQIGQQMIKHSIQKAKEQKFKLLQFNAVVKTNYAAIHLYEKLGFTKLGTIPGGFHTKAGKYEDIILYYYILYPHKNSTQTNQKIRLSEP